MKIGFIGLGNMGAPMAANLVQVGHTVTGFDVAGTSAQGVSMAGSAAQAAAGREVVITMVPNGHILPAVAGGVHPAVSHANEWNYSPSFACTSARSISPNGLLLAGFSKSYLNNSKSRL